MTHQHVWKEDEGHPTSGTGAERFWYCDCGASKAETTVEDERTTTITEPVKMHVWVLAYDDGFGGRSICVFDTEEAAEKYLDNNLGPDTRESVEATIDREEVLS